MEVHHHPEVEKKGFKEYLLEGLMIFVAVMMGFFAENLRERITNHEREDQYVRSMIADLKDDQHKLESAIGKLRTSEMMMDSLIAILDDPKAIASRGGDLYYYGRMAPRIAIVTINMRTYEQLKNSGSFSLISKKNISNDIMTYYQKVAFTSHIEDLFLDEFANYKKNAANVFEPAVFAKQERSDGSVVKGTNNPPLQKDAQTSVKALAVFTIYMNGSRKQIMINDEDMLKSSKELMQKLQEAYHLEDE